MRVRLLPDAPNPVASKIQARSLETGILVNKLLVVCIYSSMDRTCSYGLQNVGSTPVRCSKKGTSMFNKEDKEKTEKDKSIIALVTSIVIGIIILIALLVSFLEPSGVIIITP